MKIQRNQKNLATINAAQKHLAFAGRLDSFGWLAGDIIALRASLLKGDVDTVALESLKLAAHSMTHCSDEQEMRRELIRAFDAIAFAALPETHAAKI